MRLESVIRHAYREIPDLNVFFCFFFRVFFGVFFVDLLVLMGGALMLFHFCFIFA
jgi:hypothetical protein